MTTSNILQNLRQCFSRVPDCDPRSKIDPKTFLVTLALSFLRDVKGRTLASLRREMINGTCRSISRSSFWERLATKKLNKLLFSVLLSLMSALAKKHFGLTLVAKKLGVREIFLVDSTSITLPKEAKKHFKAPRKNVCPSAIKCHMCFGFINKIMHWFRLTQATSHDSNHFPSFKLLCGSLIIFDLGYFSYSLFENLIQEKIFPFSGQIQRSY